MTGVVDEAIQTLLRTAREYLDVPTAYVAEVRDSERFFRYVDTDERDLAITVGGFDFHVGECTHPSAQITLGDGRPYGTLCLLDDGPQRSRADQRVLEGFARVVGAMLVNAENRRVIDESARERVDQMLGAGGPDIVFQPIIELATSRTVGFEALSRFNDGVAPDVWFKDAWLHGLGPDMEFAAARTALTEFARVDPTGFLTINLSPPTLISPSASSFFRRLPDANLVLEITEHAAIENTEALTRSLLSFRMRGGRLAIDDVGRGYSGLHHLIELSPDIIKLDREIVANVHRDSSRQAMIAALVAYARNVGATLIAEGVETPDEMLAIRGLGVKHAQGYLFARPAPLVELMSKSAD